MGAMLRNKWTTITGVIGGIATYLIGIGPTKLPQTRPEWLIFWAGLIQIVMGIVAKDATTGSLPTSLT